MVANVYYTEDNKIFSEIFWDPFLYTDVTVSPIHLIRSVYLHQTTHYAWQVFKISDRQFVRILHSLPLPSASIHG
jgi:hypothetical protein